MKIKSYIYEINTIEECEKFVLLTGINRSIRRDLVNKYKKMYLEGKDLGPMIIEEETNGILDAQHRREAWKEAKAENPNIVPLTFMYYWVKLNDDEERKKAIQDLNNGVHWNVNDFINSNMGGDNELRRLEEFCLSHERLFKEKKKGKDKGKKSPLFRRGAAIVSGDPKYYRKALRENFKVSEDQWDEAEDIYNEIENFLVGMKLSNQTDIPAFEGIINGWHIIRNNRRYYDKITKLPNGIKDLYENAWRMDLRHTTSPVEWSNRFGSLIDCVYKELA